MAIVETLTPAELARQLANPDGAAGLEVADWLNENNSQANIRTIALLAVEAGCSVLEIGFGNGRTAPFVIAQAPDVQYAGIDISPTMVSEASAYNAELVTARKASFQLASANELLFDAGSFDRVFSIGVIHFWTEPLASLAEVRRVLRPGGGHADGVSGPKGTARFRET